MNIEQRQKIEKMLVFHNVYTYNMAAYKTNILHEFNTKHFSELFPFSNGVQPNVVLICICRTLNSVDMVNICDFPSIRIEVIACTMFHSQLD